MANATRSTLGSVVHRAGISGSGRRRAAAMHVAGRAFYRVANGVRLTDRVPPCYPSGWPG
jgi:hypothetical protein